ncbi:Pantoate-beta-alanine ligase [Suillus paluster]|uniref:Pantoate-beta-alanine ligase n=1 Tax=Suillus paluster TaxID=48578 RepID=UPI001B866431|nr:Pantoate-beta-alanine ligase [Suillus paluster]KAG1734032.1 Pantoate-beta-alanine ligase [Suillus paluster]
MWRSATQAFVLLHRSMSMSTALPPSPIPLLTSVASYRQWRQKAFDERKSVGFVPTMGALHDGHLSLVQKSLAENDLTVLSIFVNPAQFAPHEDLATYPRTLPRDLELLTAQQESLCRYFFRRSKTCIHQALARIFRHRRDAFVEMKGYGHQMEGASRPTFFRGVATVVTKLFNAVQPTNAYFGQKDIQQALLLRRLCKDLLFPHPEADHVHIVPTTRNPNDGLALSSRNAYLSVNERKFAPTLFKALQYAESAWSNGESKDRCVSGAVAVIDKVKTQAALDGVEVRLDYIEMNDSETFDVLDASSNTQLAGDIPVILSGALWVGKTRLIDNIVVGDLNRV